MATLNLTPSNEAETKIKNYLEMSASAELVDKINNGVKIQKDDKTLISKKNLSSFMKFATEEARKLVEKGSSYACVDDDIVYSWAIHYFEEDSIEGILFNEDGTEYKKLIPKSTYTPPVKTDKPKVEKEPSLFDLLLDDKEETEPDISITEEKPTQYVDMSTGEIFDSKEDSIISNLKFLFGDALEVVK